MKISPNIEKGAVDNVIFSLSNGPRISFRVDVNGGDIVYWPYKDSKRSFSFQFNKITKLNSNVTNKQSQNFIEPYTYDWDGTKTRLKTHPRYGCSKEGKGNFCAKLIQINGWKIPKDYPW